MKIVFDTETKQVGCALLQSMYGGIDNETLSKFPTRGWLLSPSSTMGVYEITSEAQLQYLIRIVTEEWGNG